MAKLRRSAKTEAQTEAKQPVQPGVIVSGEFTKRKKLPDFLKNKKFIVVGSVVLVAVIAGAAFVYVNQNKSAPTATAKVDDAHQAVLNGDFQAAEQALIDAQKSAKTVSDIAQVELGLAEAKANNGKYDEALAHAKKSNETQETVAALALIGFIAEQQNNWQLAADSYARAAVLSPETADPTQQSEYNYYKNLEKEARTHL